MCFGLEKDEANIVTARKKDLFVPNKKLNFLAQLSGVGSYSLECRQVP